MTVQKGVERAEQLSQAESIHLCDEEEQRLVKATPLSRDNQEHERLTEAYIKINPSFFQISWIIWFKLLTKW